MKKLFLLFLAMLLIAGCRTTDSIMFKEEFEKENYNNSIKVSIPSNNPFVYLNEDELVKKIENKENIIVLFGYSKSIETRNIIENLIKVANNLNIKKIYYIDIFEMRDEKNIENNEIKTIKQGTDEYNRLLELLNNNLNDYKINNQIVGKRIYAGSILKIDNDNITINNYTKEMENESYNLIYNFLNNNTCSPNEGC